MLKLNYTEVGLYMERVMTLPEMLIAQRVILAMRLRQSLSVEPGHASFLLPTHTPELEQLEIALQREYSPEATVIPVDDEFVEVNLNGSWIAESKEAHEGMFLTVMSVYPEGGTASHRAEFLIYKLWQMSDAHISSLA
jgi:predicted small secreted protein